MNGPFSIATLVITRGYQLVITGRINRQRNPQYLEDHPVDGITVATARGLIWGITPHSGQDFWVSKIDEHHQHQSTIFFSSNTHMNHMNKHDIILGYTVWWYTTFSETLFTTADTGSPGEHFRPRRRRRLCERPHPWNLPWGAGSVGKQPRLTQISTSQIYKTAIWEVAQGPHDSGWIGFEGTIWVQW